MKIAGIMVGLVGFGIVVATSFTTTYFYDKVYNWSPVIGMLVMGMGTLIYIGSTNINPIKKINNP